MNIKNKIIIGIVGALVLYGVYRLGVWGYDTIQTLTLTVDRLEYKLNEANGKLDAEINRSVRVEEIVVRLEASDANRSNQLRGFEKGLNQLKAQSAEVRAVLDTVVPADALHGLRSYDNIPQ